MVESGHPCGVMAEYVRGLIHGISPSSVSDGSASGEAGSFGRGFMGVCLFLALLLWLFVPFRYHPKRENYMDMCRGGRQLQVEMVELAEVGGIQRGYLLCGAVDVFEQYPHRPSKHYRFLSDVKRTKIDARGPQKRILHRGRPPSPACYIVSQCSRSPMYLNYIPVSAGFKLGMKQTFSSSILTRCAIAGLGG
jgi:hypothetical protein